MASRLSSARRTARRWGDAVLDWFDDQNPSEMLVFVAGLVIVVAIVSVALVAVTGKLSPDTPPGLTFPDDDPAPPAQGSSIRFTNGAGGYAFRYPRGWDATRDGSVTRLESPNGNIVLSFGLGQTDELGVASSRLVKSMITFSADSEMIGTTREMIAGAPALLTGGIAPDQSGGDIRFLAIAIGGASRTYTISITAPARADPAQVLPTIERIVSSFAITPADPEV